jgi:holo-[acyl-carrier protein] synthase
VTTEGIGIDIEEVERFDAMLARWGTRFADRIFTDAEIAYCASQHRPAPHFAARFAAKEAFGKAIGTGWRGAFAWKDVEVLRDADGRPSILLHHALRERYAGLRILVSLSHTRRLATAVVLLRSDDNPSFPDTVELP